MILQSRKGESISLLEVLRTGSFGPVELGFTKEQLMSAIGKPTSIFNNILNYNSFEFSFALNGKLESILTKRRLNKQNRFKDFELQLNNNWKLTTWFSTSYKSPSLNAIRKFLNNETIEYDVLLHNGLYTELKMKTNHASLYFDHCIDNEFTYSFQEEGSTNTNGEESSILSAISLYDSSIKNH